jgi:hypothetical protein
MCYKGIMKAYISDALMAAKQIEKNLLHYHARKCVSATLVLWEYLDSTGFVRAGMALS